MASTVILVTGSSRGIGRAIAEGLAKQTQNATIFVSARSISTAIEVAQSLQGPQSSNHVEAIELDVASDDSVKAAVAQIIERCGHLDILINNAGIAVRNENGVDDFRQAFNTTMDTNVTSVGLLTTACMPLLEKSSHPRVITVSSERASMHALLQGTLPPTRVLAYTVSKVAVNVMTLEMRKLYPKVTFHCASPGHCSTALNGFQGHKDVADGAKVVVLLTLAKPEEYAAGFWEYSESGMRQLQW